MIPDSLGAVVGFLLLIAPGTLWELLRERYVPTQRRTPLSELSRVALVSLLATASAAGLLYVPLWSTLLGGQLDPTNFLLASALTSALGCLLVCGVSLVAHRGPAQIHGPGQLHLALKEWPAMAQPQDPRASEDNPVFLQVTMDDGSMWAGSRAGYDLGPEEPHPQLALRGPLTFFQTATSKHLYFANQQEFVLLPLSKVAWIRVVPKPAKPSAENRGHSGRQDGPL